MHAVIQENVVNFGNDNIRSEARFKVIVSVVGCLFMVHGTCIYFVLIYACMHIHAFMHARVTVLFIPMYVYTENFLCPPTYLELRKIPKLVPLFIYLFLFLFLLK